MEGDANNLPSLAVSKRGSSYKAEKVMYAYGVVPQWRNKVIASTLFNKTLFNESNPLYSRDRFFIACVLKSLRQFKKYGKVNRRYALYQCETNVLQALVV